MTKKIMILFAILISIIACSDKKNLITGESQSNITPHKLILKHSNQNPLFENCFSFNDSISKYSANNTQLIFGEKNNIIARTLIKFANFPKSEVIDTLKNVKVTLKGKNISNFKIGLLTTNWNEKYVTWENYDEDKNWNTSGADFTEINPEIITKEDSLIINLDKSIVKNWIDNRSENKGLILYENILGTYNTIYSVETNQDPILSFDYITVTQNQETKLDTTTYKKVANSDIFIHNAASNIGTKFDNKIKISNIIPTQSFLKFKINKNMFNLNLSDDDFKKVTINKAELVLKAKVENCYSADSLFSLYPYIVKKDEINIPAKKGEDYSILAYTILSTYDLKKENKEFRINITPIIQAICSGDYENKGILLKAINQNKNFDSVEFYNFDEADENLKPSLEIIYTEPYLN